MDEARTILAIAASFPIALWAITARRAPEALLVALLASVAVLPLQLTSSGDRSYVGIAGALPVVSTFTISVVALVMALGAQRILRGASAFLPFVLYVATMTVFVWPRDGVTIAGVAHLMLAVLAYVAGRSVALTASTTGRFSSLIIQVVFAIVALQIIVSLGQLAGLDMFPLSPEIAAIMGDRVHGTLNHPNNLGKVLVLFSAVAVCFLGARSSRIRRTALVTLVLAGLGTALTQGRANIIAYLVIVAIGILGSRRAISLTRRAAVLLVGAIAVAPLLPAVLERFEADPTGGSRDHLSMLAVDQLARSPIFGVGANQYVNVVGAYDELTYNGHPVHNSYLLAAVELGVVGAVLFFLPMLILAFRSAKRLIVDPTTQAAAGLAVSVAFPVIAATGWGALSGGVLLLWMFSLGFLDPGRTLATSSSRLTHFESNVSFRAVAKS